MNELDHISHDSAFNHELHDKDFYAWTKETSQLLRNGKIGEVDVMNIAEELEDMGISNKRALISCFSVLVSHLLKWKFQKERRGKSWQLTIKGQRLKIKDLLHDSPSLKHEIELKLNIAYIDARLIAEKETELDIETFPESCPFSLEQCLDEVFLPE